MDEALLPCSAGVGRQRCHSAGNHGRHGSVLTHRCGGQAKELWSPCDSQDKVEADTLQPDGRAVCCGGLSCPLTNGVCCKTGVHCCPAGNECVATTSLHAAQLCRPLNGRQIVDAVVAQPPPLPQPAKLVNLTANSTAKSSAAGRQPGGTGGKKGKGEGEAKGKASGKQQAVAFKKPKQLVTALVKKERDRREQDPRAAAKQEGRAGGCPCSDGESWCPCPRAWVNPIDLYTDPVITDHPPCPHGSCDVTRTAATPQRRAVEEVVRYKPGQTWRPA